MIIIKKSIDLVKKKKIIIQQKNLKINKNYICLKIDSCGICSSDLKFINTGSRIKKFPITLGHEISAVISNNKNIIMSAEIPCKKCNSCKKFKKLSNLCDNPTSIGSSYDGGFSNYLIMKKEIFKRVPKIIYKGKIPKYAALAESIACVVNGLEILDFNKKKSIVIVGAGYMGLLFVGISKFYGSKKIAVVDYDKKRLKIAKQLGANYTYKIKMSKNSLLDKVLEPTNKYGYDCVVSANGNLNSHQLSIKLAAKKGVVNIFGGTPKNKNILFDSNQVHYREVKITGSFSSNLDHLRKAFKIIRTKKVDFSKLVTSYANFNNFNSKIKDLAIKKEIKVIFRP